MLQSPSFFGSPHILFGIDSHLGDTPKIIENIRSLNVPEEEKNMVLGDNAVKLFKI